MYTQITTIDTKLLIEKRQNILKQCHGNYTEVKKVNYMLEIVISKNYSQRDLGVLSGDV